MAERPSSPVVIDLNTRNDSMSAAHSILNSFRDTLHTSPAIAQLTTPTLRQVTIKATAPVNATTATSSSESEADETGNGRSGSPPPNCAICLGRCRKKCFTDSCMHEFCFKCLCEWSKVKPECPLCKQSFKSIIHSVKSMDQFEQYFVQPPTVEIHHQSYILESESRIAQFGRLARISRINRHVIIPSYLNPQPGMSYNRNQLPLGQSNVLVANRPLPGYELDPDNVANAYISNNNIARLQMDSWTWRIHIYSTKLYALPVSDLHGRYRESSARYYRENPSQIHRLMPFINRDIAVLLRDTSSNVDSVLSNINESLPMINISSPSFRRRMQPFLGSNTGHFVHELNNFARSPYDMLGYDRVVSYIPQNYDGPVIEFSSSSDENGDERPPITNYAIVAANNNNNNNNNTNNNNTNNNNNNNGNNSSGATSSGNAVEFAAFSIGRTTEGNEAPGISMLGQAAAINLTTHNRAATTPTIDPDVIVLDDTAIEPVTVTAATSLATTTTATVASATTSMASTSAPATALATLASAAAAISTLDDDAVRIVEPMPDNIDLAQSTSSSECEFVLARKPPHLRTPELVSLNSESDSDVVFVEEIKGNNTSNANASGQEQLSKEESDKETTEKTTSNTLPQRASRRRHVDGYIGLYMGASTSTGIRSTTRRRVKKLKRPQGLTNVQRTKKLRSSKKSASQSMPVENALSEVSPLMNNCDRATYQSNLMDTNSDSDFESPKKIVVTETRSTRAKRRQTRSNRDGSSLNMKKRKMSQVVTSSSGEASSTGSDDEEHENLEQLKARLTQQKKQQTGIVKSEASDQSCSENANEMRENAPSNTSGDEKQQVVEEEEEANVESQPALTQEEYDDIINQELSMTLHNDAHNNNIELTTIASSNDEEDDKDCASNASVSEAEAEEESTVHNSDNTSCSSAAASVSVAAASTPAVSPHASDRDSSHMSNWIMDFTTHMSNDGLMDTQLLSQDLQYAMENNYESYNSSTSNQQQPQQQQQVAANDDNLAIRYGDINSNSNDSNNSNNNNNENFM